MAEDQVKEPHVSIHKSSGNCKELVEIMAAFLQVYQYITELDRSRKLVGLQEEPRN